MGKRSGLVTVEVSTPAQMPLRERALAKLSLQTAVASLVALLINPVLAAAMLPLAIYLVIHDVLALGVGRWKAAAAGLVAAIPGLNAILLVVLYARLARKAGPCEGRC